MLQILYCRYEILSIRDGRPSEEEADFVHHSEIGSAALKACGPVNRFPAEWAKRCHLTGSKTSGKPKNKSRNAKI
ncbi:hypothetical protein ASZ90_013967 [hydrocarbon metagenome]|jgi:hypothetical protein|uniref:Uncharacterized protein n=1 Tax=hydrocarbon metagenome TaxID=938273 RepID=A0A0W8F5V7_9ZZZZ